MSIMRGVCVYVCVTLFLTLLTFIPLSCCCDCLIMTAKLLASADRA